MTDERDYVDSATGAVKRAGAEERNQAAAEGVQKTLSDAERAEEAAREAETTSGYVRLDPRHLDLLNRALVDEVDGYNDLDAMLDLIGELAQQVKADALPCLALRQIPTRRIQTCTLDDHPETSADEDAHDWVDADHRIVSAFEFGQAIQAGQMYAAVHGPTETTRTETFSAELESDDRQVALQAAVDLQVARLRGGMSMTWKDAQLAVLGGAREFLEFLDPPAPPTVPEGSEAGS